MTAAILLRARKSAGSLRASDGPLVANQLGHELSSRVLVVAACPSPLAVRLPLRSLAGAIARPPATHAAVVAPAVVDARARTLIITTPREHFAAVRQLVERLDLEIPDDAGTLFVLPLRHADPVEVAAVLGSLPSRGGDAKASGGSGGAGKPAAGAGAGAGAPGKGGNAGNAGSTSPGVSIGGEIQITADPATRSLVIMASHRDFLALRRVVEALDRERRQVYIEAYILELSTRHELGTDVSAAR